MGVDVFLAFYAISNISRNKNSANKKKKKNFGKTILFHSMFSLCFCMLDLFPTFSTNIEKCPFTYWLNGRWFLQIVDRDSGNIYSIYIKKNVWC